MLVFQRDRVARGETYPAPGHHVYYRTSNFSPCSLIGHTLFLEPAQARLLEERPQLNPATQRQPSARPEQPSGLAVERLPASSRGPGCISVAVNRELRSPGDHENALRGSTLLPGRDSATAQGRIFRADSALDTLL
jgi:hypothetical protein